MPPGTVDCGFSGGEPKPARSWNRNLADVGRGSRCARSSGLPTGLDTELEKSWFPLEITGKGTVGVKGRLHFCPGLQEVTLSGHPSECSEGGSLLIFCCLFINGYLQSSLAASPMSKGMADSP